MPMYCLQVRNVKGSAGQKRKEMFKPNMWLPDQKPPSRPASIAPSAGDYDDMSQVGQQCHRQLLIVEGNT